MTGKAQSAAGEMIIFRLTQEQNITDTEQRRQSERETYREIIMSPARPTVGISAVSIPENRDS